MVPLKANGSKLSRGLWRSLTWNGVSSMAAMHIVRISNISPAYSASFGSSSQSSPQAVSPLVGIFRLSIPWLPETLETCKGCYAYVQNVGLGLAVYPKSRKAKKEHLNGCLLSLHSELGGFVLWRIIRNTLQSALSKNLGQYMSSYGVVMVKTLRSDPSLL